MTRLFGFLVLSSFALAQGPYIIDTGAGANSNLGTGLFAAGSGGGPSDPNFQFLGGLFTVNTTATVAGVEAWMTRGPGGPVAVHFRANTNGRPGTSIFSSNTTVPTSGVTEWVRFNFNTTLPSGTYWLTFEPVAGGGFSRSMPPGAATPLASYAFLSFGNNSWVLLSANQGNLGMRIAGTTAPPPSVTINTEALSFTAPQNGPGTASKNATILVNNAPETAYTINTQQLPPWLIVSGLTGATPGFFSISADPGSLPTGTYQATIPVAFQGNFNPINIPASLTVTAPNPRLDAQPRALRFTARTNAPRSIEQSLILINTGGGPAASYQTSIVNNSTWVSSVTPSTGSVTNRHTFLRVTVNTAGLAAGVYKDTLRVTSAIGNVDIPLTIAIAPAGALLSADQSSVRFQARQGQGLRLPIAVPIRNLGDPGSSVRWTARVLRGANLIELNRTTGIATPEAPDAIQFTLGSTATDTAGAKYALIEIADPQALGSPFYIVVVIDVAPASSAVIPLPVPNTTGAALFVSSTAPVAFRTSVANNDGRGWLRVSPASGTVSTSNAADITITAATTGLPKGVYLEHAVFEIGGVVRALPVTLVYDPEAPDAPAPRTACSPSRVALIAHGTPNNFSVPAGWPASLAVNLFDDCGGPINNGSVIASFTNGDPPLPLKNDGVTNTYSATWEPRTASSMEVRLLGSAGTLGQGVITLSGSIAGNTTPPPVVNEGGIINNVNADTAGLAPGTVAAVFGTGLGGALKLATSVPLPTSLDNVEMLVAGRSAPLFYVSSGQLAAQLPTETGLGPRQTLVTVGEAISIPQTLDFVALSPGVVPFPAEPTRLIAQHILQAGAPLVSPTSPAKQGELLTIYLLGLGATNPAVASGIAAPGDPLPLTTVKPVVTVAGQTAELQYWGLVPGGVGLYQINFYVPAGVTGDAEVVISQSGVRANVTKMPVVP